MLKFNVQKALAERNEVRDRRDAQREKFRDEGRDEGRDEVQEKWEAWNERRLRANGHFDEPPPTLDR